MMSTSFRNTRKQRGAVLIVALIMLAVMTLFVVSMIKTSIIELKIGGSSHVAAINFANAEVAINSYISANNLKFAPGFLAGGAVNPTISVYGGTVAITTAQLNCSTWNMIGNMMGASGLQAVQFDIRATATGTLGGSTSLHQGVQSLAAPGSC